MQPDPRRFDLDDLGVLRIRGADALRFLQGQLSNDVMKLSDAGGGLLAGYHNPQGRVIALLRLIKLAADDVLAILPRELAAAVAAKLSKFILRAKVQIADESPQWRITGLIGEPPAESLALHIDSTRWWIIAPAQAPQALSQYPPGDRSAWRGLDIAAGIPQVYSSTSEAFVAQMLNLDKLGAIAFDKGCYTGQEIIARAHYRGKVKRRMQRFRSTTAEPLAIGDSGQFTDGRSFKIVEIVTGTNGEREFLAVAPLTGDEPAGEAEPINAATQPIAVETLPLAYALGE